MRRRLTAARLAVVLSTTALAVALLGATPVGNALVEALPRSSVGTPQLANGAVTSKKLAANAVTTLKVKDGSLLANDFKAGQIPAGPQGEKGDKGDKGDAGPSDGYAAYRNGPVAASGTVATLNIPQAGKYVVVAKAWFRNLSPTLSVLMDCRLVAGADYDQTRFILEPDAANSTDYAAASFTVAHEFAAPGSVVLQANAFGVNVEVHWVKIAAIRVGNLTNAASP
jgi:hypothetical protein